MNKVANKIGKFSRQGVILVLSSPSGAGKTTLSRNLLKWSEQQQKNQDATKEEMKDDTAEIVMSISHTTRKPRIGEKHGNDYFFVTQQEFDQMIQSGGLLEHALVFGNHYGTQKKFINEQLEKGVDILFDVDWQGTRQLKQSLPDSVVSIFILPPSMNELETRLRNRGQNGDDDIKRRMQKASSEISHWEEYDYVLVNNDLESSLDKIIVILRAERQKRSRQIGLDTFTHNLCEGE